MEKGFDSVLQLEQYAISLKLQTVGFDHVLSR